MARGTIYKRKDRFAASYYVPNGEGRRRTKSGFKKKKDAEAWLAQRLGSIRDGTYTEPKKKTFAEYAQEWIELRRNIVKPATLNAYISHLENHLVPEFEERLLTAIDTEQVEQWIARLAATKLSPKSIKNFSLLLHKIFQDAKRQGYLHKGSDNPASGIERPRVVQVKREYLTPAEVTALLDACHPDGCTALLVAVMTGLRSGELFGLRRGDLEGSRLYVRRSIYWNTRAPRAGEEDNPRWSVQEPKSEKGKRRVDLPPAVVAALEAHRESRKVVSLEVDGYIFSTETGVPQDPRRFQRRFFFPALAKAGLRRIRFHDLRHTNTALRVHAGQHPRYMQEQLGHASASFTLDVYGGLYEEDRAQETAKLEASVLGSVEVQRKRQIARARR